MTPTLREKIVEGLRDSILNGDLAPGQKLYESEVAQTFEASRTPVREAFRQLEEEGFLFIKERRGAYVAPIEAKKIREFYEIKAVLEGYAARVACAKLTESELELMKSLNSQLESCYQKGEAGRMVEVHNQFHSVFVNACGNTRLIELLDELVSEFQRFRITLSHTDAIVVSIKQHAEIIEAFVARDETLAEKLVASNSMEGSKTLLDKYFSST